MLRKIAICLLLTPLFAWATNYTAAASGNISALVPTCATGGDTVTVDSGVTLTVDVNCTLAGMTADQSSTLVVPGTTLTFSGTTVVFAVGGNLELYGGAVIDFDASTSAFMQMGVVSTTPYPLVTTVTTSIANPAIIENTGSGVACIGPGDTSTACAVGGWGKVSNWNVSYLEFLNLGNATTNSLVVSGAAGEVEIFNNAIWSGCGETQFVGAQNSTSGLNITNSAWYGSLGTHSFEAGDASVATVTATNQIVDSAFDISPEIGNGDLVVEGDYFDRAYLAQGAGDGTTTFESNLVRNQTGNEPSQLKGVESYNYYLTDYWPSPAVTSTATSATASTLTDTTQTWTTSEYAATTVNGWMVYTTAGTGADQLRLIASSPSHTLNVMPPWTTIPDATTQYAIYDGIGNVHMLAANSGTHTGDIGEFTGAYGTGKVFLNSNLTAPVTLTYNLTIPNGAGGNSAALFDFGTSSAANTVTALHNTIYTGGFIGAYVDDYLDTGAAGYIAEDSDSLFWTNADDMANNQCGSVAIEDNQHCTSGGVLNYGLPADFDYNGKWNLNNGTYLGNGYSLNLSSQAGQNDVNLAADDGPNFVDPTRGFVNWCRSLGLTGTRPAVIANCRYSLLHAYDFNGAGNAAFNPSALYAWVEAGYAPQNVLLHDAAGDGTDIGAVPYQAP